MELNEDDFYLEKGEIRAEYNENVKIVALSLIFGILLISWRADKNKMLWLKKDMGSYKKFIFSTLLV